MYGWMLKENGMNNTQVKTVGYTFKILNCFSHV